MTTLSLVGARHARGDDGVGHTTAVRLVRLRGEIDAFSAPFLRDDLRREVEARPALVAVDLSDLEFMGVAGLNVLIEVRQLADERGTALMLVGSPSPPVERLLGLIGWTVMSDPVTRSRADHRRTP